MPRHTISAALLGALLILQGCPSEDPADDDTTGDDTTGDDDTGDDDTGDDDTGDDDTGEEPTLDDRVDHALSRYHEARVLILERVVTEGGTVERAEWEGWLEPDAALALSEDDLDALRQRHADDIEVARNAAIADSVIDVDGFRSEPATVTQFCTELPKGAMLHVHPGGTRDRETVDALLAVLDPLVDGGAILVDANDGVSTMLYADEVAWLETLPVLQYSAFDAKDQDRIAELLLLPETPPTHDFMRFEALFSIGDALLKQDPKMESWVTETTHRDFLERASSLGVSYVEYTKVVIPPSEAQFEAFADLSGTMLQETGVETRWNLAFVRTLPASSNSMWTQVLIALLEQEQPEVLVGIDLLANETDAPALETAQPIYVPILDAVQQGNIELGRTMHAGELGDPRNPRDAMIMGSQRIGHGVLMADDPLTIEYARREQVPVEINLVSNLRLEVWDDPATHPFLDYLRLGLPVSLSTDDEGMFRTDIANECVVAVTSTDIQYAELAQMSRNSIAEGFMDDELRDTLMVDLEADLAAFELSWSGR